MNRFAIPFLAALLPAAAPAQESTYFDYRPATVVIYNSTDPGSTELAGYYARARGIPEANLVGLKCQKKETISRQEFQSEIETPLQHVFDERKWWETGMVPKDGLVAKKTTMRVIAIMQGIPLRIGTTALPPEKDPKTGKDLPAGPLDENAASVDSELAAFGVLQKALRGVLNNPYYNGTTPFAKTAITPMFLTGRIDGPDKATAKRLIDDAVAVEKTGLYGRAYIDLARKTNEGYKQGEDWLINAARMLETGGVPVIMDTWAPTLPQNYPMQDCAYYLGWYTDHADGPFLNPAFRFRRGAIACHIHSFSAATLKSDKLNWCGPLLSRGACGVLGNVFEPYLPLTASLDTFTDRLLAGYTLSEAAWISTRALSWMSVVIGDPLYRPFATSSADTDRNTAKEYQAIRLAVKRWGNPEEAGALNSNLERAAETLHSAEIYEFLALHAQAGQKEAFPAAKKWFDLAMTAAAKPEDQIRLRFLMADALRRDQDYRKATKQLTEVVEKFPAAPEAAAARIWIQQIKETK